MDQPPPYPGPPIQQNQIQQAAGENHGAEYQKHQCELFQSHQARLCSTVFFLQLP